MLTEELAVLPAAAVNSYVTRATLPQSAQHNGQAGTNAVWREYELCGIASEALTVLSGFAGTLDVANFQLTTESLTPFG